jgi:hypothetical protein
MIAALIFRRQLVRHNALLTANSTADKLPLEKFHRLLNLFFGVNFKSCKLYHLLCFLSSLTGYYRVLLGPVLKKLCLVPAAPQFWRS